MSLPDDVRTHCAAVAERATHVRIDHDAVAAYASALTAVPAASSPLDAAFTLQLNAINFGSGWFPTLRKPPGLSGFRTIEAGLRARGPWTREELVSLDAITVAHTFGQDPDHELMALYAAALNELGEHDPPTDGTATEIAERLAALPMWDDPGFYKRAQIAAAELAPQTAHELTMFADNLVPHVLRLDGVLTFDAALVARIDREELLEHGSAEEVEIRACALHAVELLAAHRDDLHAAAIDFALWTRGALPRYKARPRHRSRTTAY